MDKSAPKHGITAKSSNICHTPRATQQPNDEDAPDGTEEEEFEVSCPCGVHMVLRLDSS